MPPDTCSGAPAGSNGNIGEVTVIFCGEIYTFFFKGDPISGRFIFSGPISGVIARKIPVECTRIPDPVPPYAPMEIKG
jgi:hypothetical protein